MHFHLLSLSLSFPPPFLFYDFTNVCICAYIFIFFAEYVHTFSSFLPSTCIHFHPHPHPAICAYMFTFSTQYVHTFHFLYPICTSIYTFSAQHLQTISRPSLSITAFEKVMRTRPWVLATILCAVVCTNNIILHKAGFYMWRKWRHEPTFFYSSLVKGEPT